MIDMKKEAKCSVGTKYIVWGGGHKWCFRSRDAAEKKALKIQDQLPGVDITDKNGNRL